MDNDAPEGPHIKLVIAWLVSVFGLAAWGGFIGVASVLQVELPWGWFVVAIILLIMNYATAFAGRKYNG